ncbi:sulfur carrier protein ThiS [Brevundimonas aveniformis]|uniref:sulfur carrier protein ThiS n=1 Tax=Brevundimonas aveniformis TaxID=370977 RepID=UPI002490A916|nr:sulfur carrier protein ThiS [Brevundimonas aveniformis]
MDITLNGERHTTEAATIADLVKALGLDPAKVAVEHNLALTPRSLHGQTLIEPGDRIEIVQFVGGG